MDPMTIGLLGGAALGLGKSELIDKPRAAKQRHVAAVTAQYSPWTGMQPGQIEEANPFGNAMQGAAMGGGIGQSMEANDAYKAYLAKQQGGQGSAGAMMAGDPMETKRNAQPGSAWNQMYA